MLAQGAGVDATGLRQPGDGRLHLRLRRGDVDLGAVAGRQDGRLGRARQLLAQADEGRGQLLQRERKPPAQIERGGVVVQAKSEDRHGREL
jgi:hypothetical protein